jgi:hypothetical protein
VDPPVGCPEPPPPTVVPVGAVVPEPLVVVPPPLVAGLLVLADPVDVGWVEGVAVVWGALVGGAVVGGAVACAAAVELTWATAS